MSTRVRSLGAPLFIPGTIGERNVARHRQLVAAAAAIEKSFAAAGYMVHECLKVADELAKNGRKATVIDAYSLPLKTEGILEIAARNGGTIITVEDNYTGGLDAELAAAIAARDDEMTLQPMYVRQIPKSGREPQDVLDYLGLGWKQIAEAV